MSIYIYIYVVDVVQSITCLNSDSIFLTEHKYCNFHTYWLKIWEFTVIYLQVTLNTNNKLLTLLLKVG